MDSAVLYKSELFEPAREFLHGFHDEREIVIRLCRDINSYSKKLIFSAHRIVDKHITEAVYKEIVQLLQVISERCMQLVEKHSNSFQFNVLKSTISNATEEMIEALTFLYFVMNRKLLPYDVMIDALNICLMSAKNGPSYVLVGLEKLTNIPPKDLPDPIESLDPPLDIRVLIYRGDYFMGLFDLTGEIMKYTISYLVDPQTKSLNKDSLVNLQFMNELNKHMTKLMYEFPGVSVNRGIIAANSRQPNTSLKKKLDVFQISLKKVELTVYEMVIRQAETSPLSNAVN